MTSTLIYRSGVFYNHQVQDKKVLMPHRQEPTTPKIGDQVAVGRYYATMEGGVTLDDYGNIIALRETRG